MVTHSIVLVTSGQPSANPRLVKEAIALFEAGYQVSVIYCSLSPWADVHDEALFKRYPTVNWIRVGRHPYKNRLGYSLARARRKWYEFVFRKIGNRFYAAERALILFSRELKTAACNTRAVLYIGHNLGALPAVVAAARKCMAKAVFDFEDYHRGENSPHSIEALVVKSVEENYVPSLVYATAASPLIAQAYQSHFPELPIYTINNCFPHNYAPEKFPAIQDRSLRLFWFSQYVGKNRGLEQVIAAMGKTGNSDIELSLLGNCSEQLREYLTREAITYGINPSQLHFIPPVSEKDIARIAAEHHIGLAVEVPYIENRNYCLTNKIFMYLLAGNAIIFSSTQAQEQFLQHHPGIGSLFTNGDIKELASIMSAYSNDPAFLNRQRQAAYQLGQTCNWDSEQKRFLELIKELV